MKTAEFIQYPFAESGDKTAIQIATDPTGKVSIQSGYPSPYSDDPSAGGKYIERADFNWILNYFTKEIQALQINGINELNNTILTTIGYPKGARCSVWINTQTGRLDRNGATNPLCITIPIVSMKDANQTDPYTTDTALFGDWWLDDGNQLGNIKIVQANLSSAPSGYIDLAPDSASPSYVKANYPRIEQILGSSSSSQWGYFKSTSPTNFTIINPRGYFPRVWSNGSTVDSGRDFLTLQNDAIRNITGDFGMLNHDSTGADPNRMVSMLVGCETNYTNGYGWSGCLSLKQTTAKTLNPAGAGTYINYARPADTYSNYWMPTIDVSSVVSTANENRPYNFNSKWYIKA